VGAGRVPCPQVGSGDDRHPAGPGQQCRLWGRDFLASRVTKRAAPVLLVLYSQALQSVVLLVVVMAVSQPYSGAGLAWGTAAGAVGAAGLVAYYQALAVGQTAIVAPLASTGAVLPLLVDLARGERPGPVALGGLLLVLGGDRRDLAGLGGAGRAGARPDLARPAGDPAPGRRAPAARADPARPGRGRAVRAVLRRRRPGGEAAGGASSGSRSASSSAPCPPPLPGRCGPGAGGASASTTGPWCCRWPP
jgi:uncharacterized membrane protein